MYYSGQRWKLVQVNILWEYIQESVQLLHYIWLYDAITALALVMLILVRRQNTQWMQMIWYVCAYLKTCTTPPRIPSQHEMMSHFNKLKKRGGGFYLWSFHFWNDNNITLELWFLSNQERHLFLMSSGISVIKNEYCLY